MAVTLPGWPLLALAACGATLLAYALGRRLYQWRRGSPWWHPAFVAIGLLITGLLTAEIPYATYFAGAYPLHALLGPATVALGVPLFQEARSIRRILWPLLGALLAGAFVAAASALALGWLLGLSDITLRSIASKSVTTPIAIAIATQLRGDVALAAGAVLFTGLVGCLLAPLIWRAARQDSAAAGLALGVGAHGFGTAMAFERDIRAGALAAVGLSLTGATTALVLPQAARLLHWS